MDSVTSFHAMYKSIKQQCRSIVLTRVVAKNFFVQLCPKYTNNFHSHPGSRPTSALSCQICENATKDSGRGWWGIGFPRPLHPCLWRFALCIRNKTSLMWLCIIYDALRYIKRKCHDGCQLQHCTAATAFENIIVYFGVKPRRMWQRV